MALKVQTPNGELHLLREEHNSAISSRAATRELTRTVTLLCRAGKQLAEASRVAPERESSIVI